ncbi:hypothetical protein Tco_0280977 [Tanacetum coccineum]
MKEPVEMNEVAEKMSCNFPLHCLAFVATDATLSLVNSNSKIPLKYEKISVSEKERVAGKRARQLQQVITATDEVAIPADVTKPVEKDEAAKPASKLTHVMTTMKSLEDATLVSEQVAQLTKEKRELQALNTNTVEELRKAMEEVSTHAINLNEAHKTSNSLEDALSVLEQHVTQLNEENRDFEIIKTKTEEEL